MDLYLMDSMANSSTLYPSRSSMLCEITRRLGEYWLKNSLELISLKKPSSYYPSLYLLCSFFSISDSVYSKCYRVSAISSNLESPKLLSLSQMYGLLRK